MRRRHRSKQRCVTNSIQVKTASFRHGTVSNDVVSRRCRIKNCVATSWCRVNPDSCQASAVSKRCRVNTTSCQYDNVSETTSYHKWCRANMTSCRHDAVPSRRRVKTKSCQLDIVPRRHRAITTPCQHNAVSNQHRAKHDIVSI